MRDLTPRRTFAVSVVGWFTLLLAVLYALAGGFLLFVGFAAVTEATAPPPTKPTGWEALGVIVAAAAGFLGTAYAVLTSLAVPAGLGVLLRQRWGRTLTFVFAPLAILAGAALTLVTLDDVLYAGIGVAQITYGLFAILVLTTSRREFASGTA